MKNVTYCTMRSTNGTRTVYDIFQGPMLPDHEQWIEPHLGSVVGHTVVEGLVAQHSFSYVAAAARFSTPGYPVFMFPGSEQYASGHCGSACDIAPTPEPEHNGGRFDVPAVWQ